MLAVLDLLEELPNTLLPTDPDDYSKFIAARAAIRDRLEKWRAGMETTYPMQPLAEYGGNPVRIIRDVLAKCPDESPAHASSDLFFVIDADLRKSLHQDLSGVNAALVNGEWKAATVLAGSLCEALLLWKLQQQVPADVANAAGALVQAQTFKKAPPPRLEDWSFISTSKLLHV